MKNNTIFVQIAAYRDPELLPTIKDCLEKAKYPENLTFGICWQHSTDDEWDNLDEYKNDRRFKIIDVNWNESKGLCWARHKIQKLWDKEKYTLQLDSHHRFIKNWDVELMEMMKMTGSKKPIITSYAGMYDPKENKLLNEEPYKMVASNFTSQGTILFRPHAIENWKELKKPIPARFVSGHFFFTIGQHCEEYKYDPNIYFAGDEISLSIRSYTLGYDIFHPHKTIIWHEYTREGRTKHWTDFNDNNKQNGKVEEDWSSMDSKSKIRLRHMLQEEDNDIDLGEYGLGDIRSHSEYEDYAGINFKNRVLHSDTTKGIDPPVDYKRDWWKKMSNKQYSMYIKIPEMKDFEFIYIGIEDEEGNLLFRQDLKAYDENVFANFESDTKPYKYIVWKFDGEWKERYDFIF
jgi:hypothetical protein